MKVADWRQKLTEYLTEMSHRRVSFGAWDCAIFAGGAAGAQMGVDYLKGWVGTYSDMTSGIEVLNRKGYADHIDLVRQTFSEVPVSFAQEGDIAVVGDALGVVQGSSIYVLRDEGIGLVPLLSARTAFRVG
jgi:hypothetical protein